MAVLEKPSMLDKTTKKRDSQIRCLDEEVEGLHSADGLQVSEEVYWDKYYHDPDFTYEWNNGILEEKPMADYLSFAMYSWFFSLLKEFLKAHPIAKMVGLDIGFRLALLSGASIRRPDLAVVLHSNPIAIGAGDCTYQGIFDLCIEFLSDSTPQDVIRDTVEKKAEYGQAGVREYFILDRKGKETAFYRLTRAGTYAPIPSPDGIIRSEVLPGFQFRLQDLYDHPDFHDRLDDHVYNSFILLDYQTEHQRAEAERRRAEAADQRAEEEAQRAEAERQRAETADQRAEAERQERLRLAAMLKELGIDPDR